MRSKVERQSEEAEKAVRDIRRATRRQYSAEEKVRIVIAGLRGKDSVAELCRKEGINQKNGDIGYRPRRPRYDQVVAG
jgi:transposase